MSWGNRDIVKAFKASGAILPYKIVKFAGTDDFTVATAAAVSDLIIGVSNELGIAAADATAGSTLDCILVGIAELSLGTGGATRGQPLTSDASGNGVTAAPSAGVNNRLIGYALKSGASGDVIPVLLSSGYIQG